jgi:hypothetical protein
VQEVPSGARPIQAVGTRTAGFVGVAPNPAAFLNTAMAVNNWTQFRNNFFPPSGGAVTWTPLAHAVYGFFLNGGSRCYVVNVGALADGSSNPIQIPGQEVGLDVLARIDEIAIVAAPGYTDLGSYEALRSHCENLGDRVGILDAPRIPAGADSQQMNTIIQILGGEDVPGTPSFMPTRSKDGQITVYFPWLKVANPNGGDPVSVPPSGHVAGVWARSDATRGVHKAPANEPVNGAIGLEYQMTAVENGLLNENMVNCIRYFSTDGILVWGARAFTEKASAWKYINVRRLFNMIEESIIESTRWIVFEPNDRPLWQAIRRDVTAFLMGYWRDGALMGRTPEEAFYVKCDEETNPPESINEGKVIIEVGLAPVKPAEFVIFRVSQYEAGSEVEVSGG